MSGDRKKLIAFNYFGGKFTWVDEIQPYFPEHVHFIDVFCGSMAIILNKPFSKIDTANDINSEVINFFKVLREQPEELIQLLILTPVSRQEYNLSWETNNCTDLEKARRFYVRVRQSFYGLGIQRKNKGWQLAITSSNANRGETISKWNNAIIKLNDVVDKLKGIQIESKCFRELIPAMDFIDAFFYLDPPYPLDCRASQNDYKFEFTETDHRDLAYLVHNIAGKAMISSYESELMTDLYGDWFKITLSQKSNNIRSGMVQECIWMNYDPNTINGQLKINY